MNYKFVCALQLFWTRLNANTSHKPQICASVINEKVLLSSVQREKLKPIPIVSDVRVFSETSPLA